MIRWLVERLDTQQHTNRLIQAALKMAAVPLLAKVARFERMRLGPSTDRQLGVIDLCLLTAFVVAFARCNLFRPLGEGFA